MVFLNENQAEWFRVETSVTNGTARGSGFRREASCLGCCRHQQQDWFSQGKNTVLRRGVDRSVIASSLRSAAAGTLDQERGPSEGVSGTIHSFPSPDDTVHCREDRDQRTQIGDDDDEFSRRARVEQQRDKHHHVRQRPRDRDGHDGQQSQHSRLPANHHWSPRRLGKPDQQTEATSGDNTQHHEHDNPGDAFHGFVLAKIVNEQCPVDRCRWGRRPVRAPARKSACRRLLRGRRNTDHRYLGDVQAGMRLLGPITSVP